MREIKFRAFDKRVNRFVQFDAICFDEKNKFEILMHEHKQTIQKYITLMQSTGWKDKNDVEIYEKDVCNIKEIGIVNVVWDNSSASFVFRHQTATDRLGVYKQYYFSEIEMSEVDVIGFITTETNSYKEGFTPSVGSEFCHEDDVYRAHMCVKGLNV